MHITSPNFYISSYSVKKPNFTANPDRAAFYPETTELLDDVYRDYKTSLNETSFSDIKSMALRISEETQTPKKDVLKAMQLTTQFSNMKSLKIISDKLSQSNIQSMGDKDMRLQFAVYGSGLSKENQKKFFFETGINRALSYVFDRKQLAPVDYKSEGKYGIIFDEEKISQLEEIKESQPDEFKDLLKKDEMKFFYISGWDTGIPVIDRTKNLEEKTVELLNRAKENDLPLEKAIDSDLLKRVKDLGIKPVVIKNENDANELTIYNQTKPQQINKRHFLNLIEANTLARIPEKTEQQKAQFNDDTLRYLTESLCVYTPEKMSQDLKKLHEKIEDYAKSINKDVLYVKPQIPIKSTDYIHYSYKKINDIDPSKFVSIYSIKDSKEISPENTLLVFLDDCALSGNSIRSLRDITMREAGIDKRYSLLFANLKETDYAALEFYTHKSRNPADLVSVDTIKLQDVKYNKKAAETIGKPAFSYNASAIVFPYMAPDNNSELASNLALLHNLRYNSQNFSSENNDTGVLDSGSKTMSETVKETSAEYIKIMGLNPVFYEKETEPVEEQKGFWSNLFSFLAKK